MAREKPWNAISATQYVTMITPIIDQDNQVRINDRQLRTFLELDNQPRLAVSQLSKLFQEITLPRIPFTFDKRQSVTNGEFIDKLGQSDLFKHYPGVFKVYAMCYLEIFAFNWSITNYPASLTNTSKHDILRLRYNLDVLADWFGHHVKYVDFMPKLRQLEVDLGFLENKLEYIINQYGYKK